ncbi:MAG: glutamyl-tRNA reductase [Dehalococcoidia bacterium]|nr:glutamyl-tRNA reductase [Dehalococcoidia bacterium]
MKIVAIGLNHQTANLALREQLTVGPEEMNEALETLRLRVGNGVILSTCNRSEVYALMPTVAKGTESLKGFITAYHRVARRDIEPHLYAYSQRKAVRHLFRVASGLDSLIIGESQILGQVRDAYGAASRSGLTGGTLARLFHHALRVGKRARRETNIGRNALSVSRAAVEMARRALGDLRDKRVLVVGLGDAGKLAAQALADAGVADITVTNRTYQRAVDMADQLGGRAVPFGDLAEMLEGADIVVSATGSPGYTITPEMVARARISAERPLFLMDIAVPRDIDPAVRAFPGVHLYDIDDLEIVAETNRRLREQEAEKVKRIVEEEVGQYMEWLSSLEVIPTVAAIREQAENLRATELAKIMKRLPDLDEEAQRRLTAFSKALVKKLMHQPITSLKEKRSPAYTKTARELFDLGKEGE